MGLSYVDPCYYHNCRYLRAERFSIRLITVVAIGRFLLKLAEKYAECTIIHPYVGTSLAMNGIGIDISKDQEEANALTFEGEKEGHGRVQELNARPRGWRGEC